MFKNTTRRGLAIGAALSLALSGLISTPAQAAGEVVLQPTTGTTYSTFVTETFKLQASLAPGQVASNIAQLKYKVEKANTFGVIVGAAANATPTTTSHNVASTSFVVTPGSTSATAANVFTVALLNATTSSASVDVKVTAWLDSTPNDTIDSGEYFTTQTVSFKKWSDVTSTVTLTQPTEAGGSLEATAVDFAGLNMKQLSGTVGVVFALGGSNSATVSPDADGVYTLTATITKSATVSAQAWYSTSALSAAIGSAGTAVTVTNRTIEALTSSVVTGANAKSDANSATGIARINTEFSFKAVVSASATAKAGVAVSAEVSTSATLSTTKTITVNGVAYTTSAGLPKTIALTTDANGQVTLAVKPTGFVADETVKVIFKSQNYSATTTATSKGVTYAITNDAGDYAKTTKGGSVTLGFTVKDQFGQLSAKADRLKITYGGSFTNETSYVNLSAGKASVNVTAAPATASGTLTVGATLETQDSTTLNWSGATTMSPSVSITVNDTADAFVGLPAATASASISRVVSGVANNWYSSSAVSVNNAGAVVTIESKGLVFSAHDATASDKIVVRSGASGATAFSISGTVAGKYTVSFTVGTSTKYLVLTIDPAGSSEGKKVVFETIGAVKAGSTVRIKGSVQDEYGNKVTSAANGLLVSYTGPGTEFSVPTATDANGEFSFPVMIGSTETGTGTVSVSYLKSGSGTDKADYVSGSTAFTVGQTGLAPVASKITVGSFTGKVVVYAKGYTGKTVSYRIAGKWGKMVVTKDLQSATRKVGSGMTIKVDVYVDGSSVKSETITTK